MNRVKNMIFSIVFMVLLLSMSVSAATLFDPQKSEAVPSDCVRVGVHGNMEVVATKAVNLINQYRYEACKNGYPDPRNPSRKLTLNDYVPIKWSSDLEYIAKIRAVECSAEFEHRRPNGKAIRSILSPNGYSLSAENIAMGGDWDSFGTLDGISLWYDEKKDWVNQNQSAVTGHYTNMINPYNTYVGVVSFSPSLFSESYDWGYIAGEFSHASNMSQTAGSSMKDIIAVIQVQKRKLGTFQVAALNTYNIARNPMKNECDKGDKFDLECVAEYDDSSLFVSAFDNLVWTSSNPSVLKVTSAGSAAFSNIGTATVSVTGNNLSVKPVTFTAKHHTATIKKIKATCTKPGRTAGTYCKVCNESISGAKVLPALGHKLGKWKTKKAATVFKTGTKQAACKRCKKKSTEVIPKLQPKLKLSKNSVRLKRKKSVTIKARSLAKGDGVKSWASSNKQVATVTSKGKVKAIGAGNAVLTITLKSGLQKSIPIVVY